MEFDARLAAWGVLYAALMYVLGNGIWVNHLARRRRAFAWLSWLLSAIVFVFAGALITQSLTGSTLGLWEQMGSVDKENYAIIFSLYVLMSVPGATCVLLKQNLFWTRWATVLPALVVFVPAGMSMLDGGENILAGVGIGLSIAGILWVWQLLLDVEPEQAKA